MQPIYTATALTENSTDFAETALIMLLFLAVIIALIFITAKNAKEEACSNHWEPCPSCGTSDALEFRTDVDSRDEERVFWVHCCNCNYRGPQVVFPLYEEEREPLKSAEARAADAWNKETYRA